MSEVPLGARSCQAMISYRLWVMVMTCAVVIVNDLRRSLISHVADCLLLTFFAYLTRTDRAKISQGRFSYHLEPVLFCPLVVTDAWISEDSAEVKR